ncbi:hypothetical protein HQN86_23865 [Pedobacter panaciterrae]|uniref:hypothetical protein n=1 Tax=Pedobacter panaciterrae TaxID=363849 RepID=UPI00155D87F8|nr:hypothetical protein [Pedobacter panaciterrae]NQX56675.1 hypothetical protein [Pedobacter panaciterrae]
MLLLFPDALYDLDNISCSTFLYFQKETVGITLQPSISMPLGGCDPFAFYQYVQQRNPKWQLLLMALFDGWSNGSSRFHETSQSLMPFKDIGLLKIIHLSYSRTEATLENTKEFIKSIGLSYDNLFKMIDLDQAFQELMSHLFYEMFLELYGSREDIKDRSARKVDFKALYDYCGTFFNKYTIEEALVNCYFFRFYNTQGKLDTVLLSNEGLIPILSATADLHTDETKAVGISHNDSTDMVAWEIFRQILSPYLDTIDKETRVSMTADLIVNHKDKVTKLKNKCWKLAEDFKGEKNLNALVANISKYISVYVESDIQALLKLDGKTFQSVRDKIFADQKSWISLGGFIISAYSDQPFITAATSLAVLSNVLSKSISTAQENKKAISQSDYSIIYNLKKS